MTAIADHTHRHLGLMLNLVVSVLALAFLYLSLGPQALLFFTFFLACCLFSLSVSQRSNVELVLFLFLTPVFINSILPATGRNWAIVLVLAQMIAMAVIATKRGRYSTQLCTFWPPLYFLFPIALLAFVSSRIDVIDPWAWQLRGDGLNFVVSLRHLSSLQSFASSLFGSTGNPGSGLGASVLVQWLAHFSLDLARAPNGDLESVSVGLLNVFLWSALITGLGLADALDSVRHGIRSSYLSASVAVLVFFLGPLLGGLALANGFLSVPPATALLFLSLRYDAQLRISPKTPYRILAQVGLTTLLFLTWSVLALIPMLLLAEHAFQWCRERLDGSRRFGYMRLGSKEFILLAVAFLIATLSPTTIQSVLSRSGGFPSFPVYQFAAIGRFCLVSSVGISPQCHGGRPKQLGHRSTLALHFW